MPVSPEFHLFLPQMRMSFETMVERAQAAEGAGFVGIALMDHLAPPLAESHDMHDAMVTAAWLAAHTSTLTVSHLVLCDTFRHPAVLAKQAVALDHASGGRFELGLGWGSWVREFEQFGIEPRIPSQRFERLRETVDVLGHLWSGEAVTYAGQHHRLDDADQRPRPTTGAIPLVIGGAGPRTMELVSAHATWWNCPWYSLDRFDELRHHAGNARASVQQMVAIVRPGESQRDVQTLTARRFGPDRDDILIGTTGEIATRLSQLVERGVERFYLWLTDFAPPSSLELVGAEIIDTLT